IEKGEHGGDVDSFGDLWIGPSCLTYFLNVCILAAIRRADLEHASIAPQERVLLGLVKLVTQHAYRCQDADVQKVREAGWTDPQIAEAVYVTAMFAFFNRVADAFG